MTRTLAALAYMGLILALSLRPAPEAAQPFPHADKLVHFAAYAIMAAFWMRALWMRPPRKALAASIAISALFGAGVEALQSFTPSREASLLDALANGLGAAVGAYALMRLASWIKSAREA